MITRSQSARQGKTTWKGLRRLNVQYQRLVRANFLLARAVADQREAIVTLQNKLGRSANRNLILIANFNELKKITEEIRLERSS